MHYARDLQTYSAASGFPWTVVSGLAIPEAMAKRRIYAWVGISESVSSDKFQVGNEIVLKSGAVEGSAVEVAAIAQKSMMNGGHEAGVNGWWDNFCSQDAVSKNGLAPARTGGNLLRLDFNFRGVGSVYASCVDLAPLECNMIKANWAQLRITSLNYPTIGTSGNLLLCFLGVFSETIK